MRGIRVETTVLIWDEETDELDKKLSFRAGRRQVLTEKDEEYLNTVVSQMVTEVYARSIQETDERIPKP